jgi:hypothetical protein
MSDAWLRPGAEAVIAGLIGRPALNGVHARLLFFRDGRWAVECEGEKIKVRPRNLARPNETLAEKKLREFEGRLVFEAAMLQQRCTYSATELLEAARAEVTCCQMVDRSEWFNATGQHGNQVVLTALRRIVDEVARANGALLVLAQRTAENEDHLLLAFGMSKHGEELTDGGCEPIHAPAPGWLAWVRDDYFYASTEHELSVARRLLVNFAHGVSECCICLEELRPPPPRPPRTLRSLPCCAHAHFHDDCLAHALAQNAHCPLCRAPAQ